MTAPPRARVPSSTARGAGTIHSRYDASVAEERGRIIPVAPGIAVVAGIGFRNFADGQHAAIGRPGQRAAVSRHEHRRRHRAAWRERVAVAQRVDARHPRRPDAVAHRVVREARAIGRPLGKAVISRLSSQTNGRSSASARRRCRPIEQAHHPDVEVAIVAVAIGGEGDAAAIG